MTRCSKVSDRNYNHRIFRLRCKCRSPSNALYLKLRDMHQMHHQAGNPWSIARGKTDVSCGCDMPRQMSDRNCSHLVFTQRCKCRSASNAPRFKRRDMHHMQHQASNPCSIARGKTDISCGCDTQRKVSDRNYNHRIFHTALQVSLSFQCEIFEAI